MNVLGVKIVIQPNEMRMADGKLFLFFSILLKGGYQSFIGAALHTGKEGGKEPSATSYVRALKHLDKQDIQLTDSELKTPPEAPIDAHLVAGIVYNGPHVRRYEGRMLETSSYMFVP